MRAQSGHFPVLVLLLLSMVSGGCSASEGKRAAAEGARLYDQGNYDAALPLLEKAVESVRDDGQLYYQLAYIHELKGDSEKAKALREKAEPLLVRLAASTKGSLEDSYYLTALYRSQQRTEEMKQAAEAGLKKFAQRIVLSGEDLFRLGRLYEFAGNGPLSATTYRQAVGLMEKEKSPNPILFALALSSDADTDLQSRRFEDAAGKLERAESLNPKSPPAAFRLALVELAAARYPQARSRFGQVQDEATISEAQYGADVARHLESCGGRVEKTPEGKLFAELDKTALEASLADAARSYREAKDKEAGGSEKLREAERTFFSLSAEWMLRGNSLRDTSLGGNYADLIRR